jgi:hypothetical protein
LGREQVAAAEDGPPPDVSLHFGQEAPAAGAHVPLLDRAAVDSDGGDAGRERSVENLEEAVAAFPNDAAAF